MDDNYILECENITKSFGGTKALKGVWIQIKPGEVHALLGENGAGKSTLMKIVIGLLKQDGGTMTFAGKPYQAHSPVDAMNAGISMIHQELNPEPYLTIAESVFLKREDTKGIFLDKAKQNRRCEVVLKKFGFPHPATTKIKNLTLAEVQMVEIIKAVTCNSRLIIMDEPTSSLDNNETKRLFDTIRDLKKQGVAIIYISHRMEEIFEICDRVSVFRDGTYIATKEMQEITRSSLIPLMVGREVKDIFPKKDCKIGETVLRVDNISGKGFHKVSFDVHKGEILGLTGLVGSGRSETMRAIFGLDPILSGKMYLNGKEITNKNVRSAIKKGICMVNEDRKNFGLCLFRSIRENVSLPNLFQRQKSLILNKKRETKEVLDICNQLMVKCTSIEHNGISMSGGNQQKVVLAKWLMASPSVLILDEPTRGVDVGAKSEIHSLICEFAARGMAIILISSELPEVMGMSDRILIYHEGSVKGIVSRKEILEGSVTQNDILAKEFGES